jgi:hypothetical protein
LQEHEDYFTVHKGRWQTREDHFTGKRARNTRTASQSVRVSTGTGIEPRERKLVVIIYLSNACGTSPMHEILALLEISASLTYQS